MVKIVLTIFLIGHFLGDFYLQSSKVASKKDSYFKVLLKHSIAYMLIMIILTLPLWNSQLVKLAILLGFIHFIIDFMKFCIKRKCKVGENLDTKIYVVDQLIHIFLIYTTTYVTCYFYEPIRFPDSLGEALNYLQIDILNFLSWILMILFITKPSSITIKKILIPYKSKRDEEDTGYENAGALIGMLERFIMLLLIYVGQYSAIGFILTAKSIVRYKKITEYQNFSEYYLLGTLLSILLVIVSYTLIF